MSSIDLRYRSDGTELHSRASALASDMASKSSRFRHLRRPRAYVYCLGGVAERTDAAVLWIFARRVAAQDTGLRTAHPRS